jgi:hypothetical protein
MCWQHRPCLTWAENCFHCCLFGWQQGLRCHHQQRRPLQALSASALVGWQACERCTAISATLEAPFKVQALFLSI